MLNKYLFEGYVTKGPYIYYSKNGDKYLSFILGTKNFKFGKNSNWEYIPYRVFGCLVDVVEKRLKEGAFVTGSGRIHTFLRELPDGKKIPGFNVVVEEINIRKKFAGFSGNDKKNCNKKKELEENPAIMIGCTETNNEEIGEISDIPDIPDNTYFGF